MKKNHVTNKQAHRIADDILLILQSNHMCFMQASELLFKLSMFCGIDLYGISKKEYLSLIKKTLKGRKIE